MGDLVGFKEFGYRGINWCLFKLAAGTPMPLLPCTNENALDLKIFSLILHIFAGDNPNMSRFKAYENLDRRCSQLSAHLKFVDTDSYKPCVIVSLSLIIIGVDYMGLIINDGDCTFSFLKYHCAKSVCFNAHRKCAKRIFFLY